MTKNRALVGDPERRKTETFYDSKWICILSLYIEQKDSSDIGWGIDWIYVRDPFDPSEN